MRAGRSGARRVHTLFVVAGLCLLAVGTAACAGPKHAAVKAPPTTPVPTTTTTAPPPPVYPLTGLPVTDPASAGRPALNVKIDNAPQARPQSGLDKADVVYEEVVEGGITRYLAVFQSHDAAPLGPIRSVRMTDADVVHPIGGLFAYSGGIPAFINDVRAAGVIDVGANADPSAYTRSNSRQSPHNLYSSTSVLRQATPAGLGPPKPVFAYRQVAAPFGGTGVAPISHFQVSMSPSVTSEWDWDPATARWLRSINGAPQVATDGVRIAFANVIIEMVPYHNTGFVDPAGNPVPDASVVGNGPAVVLSGGSMLSGSWSKASPAAVTTFADSAGTPVLLTPGTTWIELAPSGSPTASH